MTMENHSAESGGSRKKRLFVAIKIPEDILQQLEKLQNTLKPFARDAKWVRVEGIHLTLKFLGYVEVPRLDGIVRELQSVAVRHSPIPVEVKGCGFFPNDRRPKVLWTGVEAEALIPLQDSMEESMSQLGFEKESRSFSPHLTLARFRDTRGRLPLVQESRKWHDANFGNFVANCFVLYESILRPQGAQYVILHRFPLKDK